MIDPIWRNQPSVLALVYELLYHRKHSHLQVCNGIQNRSPISNDTFRSVVLCELKKTHTHTHTHKQLCITAARAERTLSLAKATARIETCVLGALNVRGETVANSHKKKKKKIKHAWSDTMVVWSPARSMVNTGPTMSRDHLYRVGIVYVLLYISNAYSLEKSGRIGLVAKGVAKEREAEAWSPWRWM